MTMYTGDVQLILVPPLHGWLTVQTWRNHTFEGSKQDSDRHCTLEVLCLGPHQDQEAPNETSDTEDSS